ncbi:hypothetical protein [Cohaesibacter marisflavi]|uniref:hypothetical protein n=1 Tax=Cohaesibacter marisflavi TaxID=655353 RepID=UPI0029C864D9|nr:hypothetical protein [Cohaesibacter marisflavi]
MQNLKLGIKVRIRDLEDKSKFLDGVGTVVEVQESGLGTILKVVVGDDEDWYLSERLEPLLHSV